MLNTNLIPNSATATHKSHDRSERYTFLDTQTILNELIKLDYFPVSGNEARTRKPEVQGFQKHLIKFRKGNQPDTPIKHELVIVNSHSGTSSLQLYSGIFRAACSNGLITYSEKGDSFRVSHVGHQQKQLDNFLEGVYHVIDNKAKHLEAIERYSQIQVTQDTGLDFARQALALRCPDNEGIRELDERDLACLMRPTRRADLNNDLWTVFNVVQEKLVRGGFRYYDREAGQYKSIRAINSPQNLITLNRDLWKLMVDFSKEG